MNGNFKEKLKAMPPEMRQRVMMEVQAKKRERMRKKRRADVICIFIMGVFFSLIVILNLFQFNRPTESEVERRKLAEFPKFSLSSFLSGEFTEGINLFFADTFVFRDNIVLAAKKLDTLKGYDYSLDGEGSFVVLDTGVEKDENDSSVGDTLSSLLGEDGETTDGGDKFDPGSTNLPTLVIDKTKLTLTVGGGAELNAVLYNTIGELSWNVSDDKVLEVKTDGDKVTLKALKAGKATISCTSGALKAECIITVEKIASGGVDAGDTADFMTNGLFIYGDAVYTKGWYLEKYAADYAGVLEYYQKIFPNAKVSACVIPTSAIRIDNEEIKSKIPDQGEIFDKLSDIIGEKVNFVDTYGEMYKHRDEYIYFKSDHHWTQRGAYYAYRAFVESVGLEAAELDDFNIKTLTDSYSGSMYEYTKDERVKSFKDTIEAFMSKKTLTMTVTDRSGNVKTYDSAIMEWSKTYSAFLCGDNPYTVINVPENPQDRNILVIKDSYGNAFVPFLAENYGNIMIVDTRYTSMNVKEMFADYDLTDILFVNNLEAANSPAWAKMYLKAVGVEIE
ncbi:MAG: hypothetical protein IKM46_05165 [Clostridia bacterium]|nr:hypothetical protein [Clostridia bacterium]